MILFLSNYPKTEADFRDGFFQRVVNVDKIYDDVKKVYLSVGLFKFFKKNVVEQSVEKRVIIECNIIIHFFLILNLFRKANLVYIQSIYNLLYLFVFVKMLDNFYVLDLHGLVIDELVMLGQKKKAKIFGIVEGSVYNKLDVVIGVTDKLISFYSKRYPNAKAKYIVYSILPNNLRPVDNQDLIIDKKSRTYFVYSGNLQPWQNIDLMTKIIKKFDQQSHFFFQILTGDVVGMRKKFDEYNVTMTNIDIRSVLPEELGDYYKKAHYGFILRDDIAINNVACPTKLIEYLNYGIIPIVLSDEIGDFKKLGYEYIPVSELVPFTSAVKSSRNVNILKKLYVDNSNSRQKLRNLVG